MFFAPVLAFWGKYALFIKLALVGLAIGAAGYSAWSWRGALADREKTAAVNAAVTAKVNEIAEAIDKERGAREEFRKSTEAALDRILARLKQINVTQVAVSKSIAEDVRDNPDFYSQPLPPKGREAWIQARTLALQAAVDAALAANPSLGASSPR